MSNEKLKERGVKGIPKWIKEGIDKHAILFAEEFGKFLAKPPGKNSSLSTSQIRIAYGEITRLKMKPDRSAMLLIKPKLAYAAKRANNSDAYVYLRDVIGEGINTVADAPKDDEEEFERRFKNLAQFFEAVLAYHKSYGGN